MAGSGERAMGGSRSEGAQDGEDDTLLKDQNGTQYHRLISIFSS
jgi:hypothetical protein